MLIDTAMMKMMTIVGKMLCSATGNPFLGWTSSQAYFIIIMLAIVWLC